jgi:uncharacterized protein YndB with AHSA1/START domain
MSVTAVPAVRQEIKVNAPIEHAFEVFTGGLASWWPLESHHIGGQPAETAVLEPRAGGRWFERAADGSECDWGSVLVWEPPKRVVLSWHLGADWSYDPDPERASEVEVTFVAEGESATRVALEHRRLERHGAGAEKIREAVSGRGGWPILLEAFAAAAADQPN